MAERFLNPPQGPTSLRAPQLNQGADVLGNTAGNDPGMLGKIAQMLMKLREPLGLATMGMGGGSQAGMPPAGRNPLMREATYNTGLNVRPPGGLPPSQETLDAQRVNVGKNALTSFMQELANMKRSADIAEAKIPYPPGGWGNGLQAPPASSFGKPGAMPPPVPQTVPPLRSTEGAVNPNRMGRPAESSRNASVVGLQFDPRNAVLTKEEIQAIFKSMQPPPEVPKTPKAPRPPQRHGPRIGRSVVDRKKAEE